MKHKPIQQNLKKYIGFSKGNLFRLLLIVSVGLIVVWLSIEAISVQNWPLWTGLNGKSLWDMAELVIIPLSLAFIAFFLNRTQRKQEQELAQKERETDRQIAEERVQETVLQNYLDRMTELLLEKNLRSSATDSEIHSIARVRTITVLQSLTGTRQGRVLQFLKESRLIDKTETIIELHGAILQGANLEGINLEETNLSGIDFQNANLREVNFKGTKLNKVVLKGANLEWADLEGAVLDWVDLCSASLKYANLDRAFCVDVKLDEANLFHSRLKNAWLGWCDLQKVILIGAQLQGSYLKGAKLSGLNLDRVNLANANLKDADLRGTNLSQDYLISLNSENEVTHLEQGTYLKGARYNNNTKWPDGFRVDLAELEYDENPEDDEDFKIIPTSISNVRQNELPN